MDVLIVLAFVFSLIALATSVGTLLYLRYLAHKEHDHVRKLMVAIRALKDHLQTQFSRNKAA